MLRSRNMADHPYREFPDRQFWRSMSDWGDGGRYGSVYEPRFTIARSTRISTAGSCFAQHIGRRLQRRGFNYCDFEPSPYPRAHLEDFGYGLFSCRYGNIYTSRQLLQLIERSEGTCRAGDELWEQDGRVFDPFRPSIEPNGFASRQEALVLREHHLRRVAEMFRNTDLFIFTFGLTEVWLNRDTGTAYPTCPGTVAGRFDADRHVFRNLSYMEVMEDMEKVISWLRAVNPALRFLFTVSPVPLAATATRAHVVSATTYSKSVLRAVAGDLCAKHDFIDYFPSYEIVTSPASRGAHYAANRRDVTPKGVDLVLGCFLAAHGDTGEPLVAPQKPARADRDKAMLREAALICDEEKLDPVAAS
jgi:hypothetical protein